MLSLKYRLMCICWFLWMSLCECLGQMSPQDCKTWNQLQCEDQWVPWGMFKKSVTFLCFAQHKDIWKIVGNQIVLVTIDFNCKNEKNPGKKRNPALSELDVWENTDVQIFSFQVKSRLHFLPLAYSGQQWNGFSAVIHQ